MAATRHAGAICATVLAVLSAVAVEAAAYQGAWDEVTVSIVPAQPRPGQPFMLSIVAGYCEGFRPNGPNDRIVRKSGRRIAVKVPQQLLVCGLPPPGRGQYLLHLPALTSGHYALDLVAYDATPEVVMETIRFDVLPGVAAATPSTVPGPGLAWLLGLSGLVVALAMRALRK